MTPLPAALGGSGLVAWRLERDKYLPNWMQAEGAYLVGGRWSSKGRRVIYASLDPATTILEIAVHKGFDVLDTLPHTLLELDVVPTNVHVVPPSAISNPNWLRPGTVSLNQQRFGDDLLDQFPIIVLPSVVSTRSWNLLINANTATGQFGLKAKESFALDTRLTPSTHP